MIRPARPGDAAALAALWNPYIRDTTVTFTTEEKTEAGLAAMIAERQGKGWAFLVAEGDSRLLGFATYGTFRNGPGYARSFEHTVLLSPAAKGRGLGRDLMTSLLSHARSAGAHAMIGGVSAENASGAAFHAAIGFTLIARLPEVGHKFGRYLDLLLYQKILS